MDGWSGEIREPDVWESDREITVEMELPGEEGDEISIEGNAQGLSVKMERKEQFEKEDPEEGVYMAQRSYTSIHRHIPLPSNLDMERMEASYEDSVLHVRIPKARRKSRA